MMWLACFGLLLPILFLLRWKIDGAGFGGLESVLWPASIALMGLEGNHSAPVTLFVYAAILASNVVFYAFVGLLSWPLLRLFLGHTQNPQK